METMSISQELLIVLQLKKIGKNQTWLAKKLSTKKRTIYQPQVSLALSGRDPQLLAKISKVLMIKP